MIIICYGLNKSASSFTFQLISDVIDKTYNQSKISSQIGLNTLYIESLDDLTVKKLEKVEEKEIFVIKTHSKPNQEVIKRLENGSWKAVISIRDSLDIIVSLLDVGKKERKKEVNKQRPSFANIRNIQDATKVLSVNLDILNQWTILPNTFISKYDDICFETEKTLSEILEFLKINSTSVTNSILKFQNKQSVWEFNVGKSGRGKKLLDLTKIDSNIINKINLIHKNFNYEQIEIKTMLLNHNDINDQFLNWLKFLNPGMLLKGNLNAINYVIKNLKTSLPIIEIGSFCGLSTNAITYLLSLYNKENQLYTSDKWIFGEKDRKISNSNIEYSDLFTFAKSSFIRNVKFFNSGRLPFSIELFSDEFFNEWHNNKTKIDIFGREVNLGGNIEFAYIDGNHDYDYVKNDFINVDKVLIPGGFILFDDSADGGKHESSLFMKEIRSNENYKVVSKNPNYLVQKIQ